MSTHNPTGAWVPPDYLNPDDHEAHRRMAAQRVGNFIGCAEDCQTAADRVEQIKWSQGRYDGLTSAIRVLKQKSDAAPLSTPPSEAPRLRAALEFLDIVTNRSEIPTTFGRSDLRRFRELLSTLPSESSATMQETKESNESKTTDSNQVRDGLPRVEDRAGTEERSGIHPVVDVARQDVQSPEDNSLDEDTPCECCLQQKDNICEGVCQDCLDDHGQEELPFKCPFRAPLSTPPSREEDEERFANDEEGQVNEDLLSVWARNTINSLRAELAELKELSTPPSGDDLRAALRSIAQYDPRWTGQHSNDAPSRQQLIERAFDALSSLPPSPGDER